MKRTFNIKKKRREVDPRVIGHPALVLLVNLRSLLFLPKSIMLQVSALLRDMFRYVENCVD
jgi:hypothetical protein